MPVQENCQDFLNTPRIRTGKVIIYGSRLTRIEKVVRFSVVFFNSSFCHFFFPPPSDSTETGKSAAELQS
jgi:hypothetical protein